jgi:hypothetical protein
LASACFIVRDGNGQALAYVSSNNETAHPRRGAQDCREPLLNYRACSPSVRARRKQLQ